MHNIFKSILRHRVAIQQPDQQPHMRNVAKPQTKLQVAKAPYALMSSRNNESVVTAFQGRRRAPLPISQPRHPKNHENISPMKNSSQLMEMGSTEASQSTSGMYQSILSQALALEKDSKTNTSQHHNAKNLVQIATEKGNSPVSDSLSSQQTTSTSPVSATTDLPSLALPPQQADPDKHNPISFNQNSISMHVHISWCVDKIGKEVDQEMMSGDTVDFSKNEITQLRAQCNILSSECKEHKRIEGQMSEVNQQLRQKLLIFDEQNTENVAYAKMELAKLHQQLANKTNDTKSMQSEIDALRERLRQMAVRPRRTVIAEESTVQSTKTKPDQKNAGQPVSSILKKKNDNDGWTIYSNTSIKRRYFRHWWRSVLSEHRRRVALRQFHSRRLHRILILTFRAWQGHIIATQNLQKNELKGNTQITSSQNGTQTYIKLTYSPDYHRKTKSIKKNEQQLALTSAHAKTIDRLCIKFQQRNALRCWQHYIARQKHIELQEMIAYSHLFKRMMTTSLRRWYQVCKQRQNFRKTFRRAAIIIDRLQNYRLAKAMHLWWRNTATIRFEETIVHINLAADAAVRALRLQLDSINAATKHDQRKIEEMTRREMLSKQKVDQLSIQLENFKTQDIQRHQELAQSRQEQIAANNAASEVNGELRILQTNLRDVKKEMSDLHRYKSDLEERLKHQSNEAATRQEASRCTIVAIQEELVARKQQYNKLLNTSSLEKKNIQDQISNLQIEMSNKNLTLEDALRQVKQHERQAEISSQQAKARMEAHFSRFHQEQETSLRLREQLNSQAAEIQALKLHCASLSTQLIAAKRHTRIEDQRKKQLQADLLKMADSNTQRNAPVTNNGTDVRHENVRSTNKVNHAIHDGQEGEVSALANNNIISNQNLETSVLECSIEELQERMMQRLRSSMTSN